MLRIGRMIRSAKMNASTPPKLMPPFQSTAASGTLPTEQTKLTIATSGPTTGPHSFASVGWWARKSPCQKEPEVEDGIRRREGERDRGGEVGAAPEQRASERDGCVGARRGRSAERRRDAQGPRRVVRQEPPHLALRDHGLHGAGEGETQDQGPEELPGHPAGERQRPDEVVSDRQSEGHPATLPVTS